MRAPSDPDPFVHDVPMARPELACWIAALRLHGDVANDNAHAYRRRHDDPPEGIPLQLTIASAPKAS